MILVLLLLSAFLMAGFFIFAEKIWQYSFAIFWGLIFFVSFLGITFNITHHYGMKQVVTTEQTPLVSSENQGVNMLLYKPLGDGKEKIYIYKTDEQSKVKTTGTNEVTNIEQTTTKNPQLVSKKSKWVYKNTFYKCLFGTSRNNGEYIKQVNVFEIPADWLVLSTTQAENLGKLMEEKEGTMKTEEAVYVKEKMAQSIAQNPNLTSPEQKELAEKFMQEFQQKAMAEILAEVQK